MWKTILRLLRWGGIIGRLRLTYTNIYKIGIAQKTLLCMLSWPTQERNLKNSGYMSMDNRFTLLNT